MKKMLDWLMYLLWGSEIVFLAASTPHIATYFQHFDNPTDLWGTVYSWLVGYGLAFTIDGVTFVVLMSLVVAIKYRRPWWLTSFLIFALLLISSLSWFINWQYDIVFSSTTFVRADSIQIWRTSIGNLNPLIGGAFPLLSVLYALVAKALEVDESALTKAAMSPEQFANEKLRLQQEQELKTLKASGWNGKGLLTSAKERLVGVSADTSEDTSTDTQMDTQTVNSTDTSEDILTAISADISEDTLPDTSADTSADIPIPMKSRQRRLYINLDDAILATGYSRDYLRRRVSLGKVKAKVGSKDVLLLSSLNEYLVANRKQPIPIERNTDELPIQIMSSNSQKPVTHLDTLTDNSDDTSSADTLDLAVMALEENPDITDEQLADLLGMSRPASARFYKIKARELVARPS